MSRHRLTYFLCATLSLVAVLGGWGSAYAGAGWGDSTFLSGAPKKVPTYYANSPAGLRPDPFGLGPDIDTGTPLRKFIDPLPGLCGPAGTPIPAITGGNGTPLSGGCIPVANPDTTTYPGSDYYVIGVVEYSQYMHGDLPKPTKLRGYVQMNDPANPVTVSNGVVTQGNPRYMGPIIVATKDRPVRIKLVNLLPTGAAGDLFIPVDHTLMGAGMGPQNANGTACDPGAPGATCASYTENRALVHLHGGFTPWISDGTPFQWVVPAGENTPYLKGASFQNVPDMADPGAGAGTLFYTNNQSSRLMFYHDHAVGITRLNVYVGEAAGYLLADKPGEGENLLPLPTDQIPLVIQEKTFVPKDVKQAVNSANYTGAAALLPQGTNVTGVGQDEKWDTTHWGQYGDLWFPNVYEFNQDPASFDGTNPVGRWDYGPYFWPVFPADLPLPTGVYGDASTTPEAFNDTPVINGVAYPTLTVDPKAYRLRILNAANDRFFNLGLYVAGKTVATCTVTAGGTGYDPAKTALTFTGGHDPAIPNPMTPTGTVTVVGGAITAINLDTFGSGYLTAPTLTFTNTGTPVGTGSGATATCSLSGNTEMVMVPFDTTGTFPTTGGLLGTGWGQADMRVGGVPSPVTAGPDIVQIGTEGGLLPAPVVIPSTPINYEYNKRSVTVLNVLEHGLFLGPAERADAVVDFSQFAGKTLILYNDSPAPVPAGDPRIDYYTGNPDFSTSGGTATTKPGYGPNIRTIMQIKVNAAPQQAPYDVAALTTAFPAAYSGTQDKPLVPQTAYNSAFNPNPAWTDTFARIFSGAIYLGNYQGLSFTTPEAITYTPAPNCTTSATCTALLPIAKVTSTPGQTISAYLESKAIQELFDAHGRMNATLGTELLFTNALNQTTLPLGYIDPATETIADGETQFWKITHNGVDSHPVHFHLVNVQLINRVGWDGTIKPPAANEIGWKETVRMNPLEDVIVAVRAKKPPLPGFGIPQSSRFPDPSQAPNASMGFTQIDPFTGNPAVVNNGAAPTNFGWEYVWHCHILGHEENDFMRPFILTVVDTVPTAPANLSVLSAGSNVLTWSDMSNNEIGFHIYRSTDGGTTFSGTPDASALANATSFTDSVGGGTYTYCVKAWNSAGESACANGPTGVTAGAVSIPSAPTGLTAVNGTGLTVNLAWTDNANNESGFHISRDGLVIATVAANTATYTDATVSPSTTYSYLVTAFNAAGDSAAAGPASVTTPAVPAVTAPLTYVPVKADFNGDGKVDIVWRNTSTGQDAVWYMNGVTTIGNGTIATVTDQNWKVVGIGDFNGDGKPDLLWRNTLTGANTVWYMNGVNAIGYGSLKAVTDQNWTVAGVGDFNGDGKPDILWRNISTGANSVWYMNGFTVTGYGSLPSVADLNWKVKGIADFNGDGKPDIFWRNTSTGQNAVWYLNGVAVSGYGSIASVTDPNWSVANVGDYNGDGKPDILWRNTSTGANVVWYLNGVATTGYGTLAPLTDQNWKVVGQY